MGPALVGLQVEPGFSLGRRHTACSLCCLAPRLRFRKPFLMIGVSCEPVIVCFKACAGCSQMLRSLHPKLKLYSEQLKCQVSLFWMNDVSGV